MKKRESGKKTKSYKKTPRKRIVPKKPVRKTRLRRKITLKTRTEKTPKVSVRVPTQIPRFDELIEGGFAKNSTNLVVGNAGSGKSIFCTQVLLGGMKKGEKCLYVTFEEKKEEFYSNMMRFGWDLKEYEKKGLFIFLEYTPVKVKTMLEEGGGAIESIILRKKVSRVVIDSITSFALLFNDELQKREAALSLFNMISKWNCTSLLTLEGKPLEDEKMASRTLEFESDSIILFYYNRQGGERKRYFEILKMRGTKHSKKMYNFNIGPVGMAINPRPVKKIL